MNNKKRTFWIFALVIILLTGCGGKALVQSTATLPPPTITPIPPTITPIPSPTLPPVPTAIPGSNDLMTIGDYKFQISEVQLTDTLNVSGGPVSNYKGALVMTANGFVPKDATPGGKLLMIFTSLQSDNYQSFIDADLKIIEEGSEKSAIAILTQDQENRVIWVYDVKPSSSSFLFVFPDDTAIDLTPLMGGTSATLSVTSPTEESISFTPDKKLYFYDTKERLDDKPKDEGFDWRSCEDAICTIIYKYTITEDLKANAYEYFLSDMESYLTGGKQAYIKIEFQHGSQQPVLLAEWANATKEKGAKKGEYFEGRYGDKIVVTIILPQGVSFTLYAVASNIQSYIGIGEVK